MVRLSTDSSLEVASVCVDYLSERSLRDRGLFKSQPSLVDVRKLQSRIIESNCRRLGADGGVLDGQLVAAALHLTLNEMPESTMAFVYPDLLECADIGNDFNRCRGPLVRLLSRLDLARFNFSRQLFAFLYRLGTTPGNDANLSQLVFIFAPLLCRLPNSTYMSVRHMEDLRRLRPVLQVVLEHHAELFQEATPGPSSTVTSTAPKDVAIDAKMASQGPPSASRSMGAGTTATGRMGVRKNLFIDLSGAANAGNDAADILAPISYISPPMSAGALGVSLSSGSGSSSGESDVNDVDFAQLNPHMHRAVNFQSKEWEVLEDLVQCLAHSYLTSPQFYKTIAPAADTKHTEGDELLDAMDEIPSKYESDVFGKSGSAWGSLSASSSSRTSNNANGAKAASDDASGSGGKSDGKSSSQQSRPASNTRRRMVYECRSLRQQINKWENDFQTVHNRKPSAADRGAMTATYNRYRDMKRDIRNSAATDIQRVARGHLVRRRGRGDMDRSTGSSSRSAKSQVGASPDTTPPSVRRKLHGNPNAASPGKSASKQQSNAMVIEDLTSTPQPVIAEAKSTPSGAAMTSSSPSSKGSAVAAATPPPNVSVQDQLSPTGKQMYAKFKDLLLQKRTLKRKLKRFDEDFQARTGRLPKKADKEVMRPHYQKYHEIRGEMQVIRAHLESELGYLPQELQDGLDNDGAEGGVGVSSSAESDSMSGAARPRSEPQTTTSTAAASPRDKSGGLFHSASAPKLVGYSASGSSSGSSSSSSSDGKAIDDDEEVLMRFEQQTTRGAGFGSSSPDSRSRSSSGGSALGAEISSTSTVPPRSDGLANEWLASASGSLSGSSGSRPSPRTSGGSTPSEAWGTPTSSNAGTTGSGPIAPISGVLISKLSSSSPGKSGGGVQPVTSSGSPLRAPNTTTGIAAPSSQPSIEDLQREKKQLHSILKAYERDFNQIHGRHVMRPEDIAPVAAEYHRYKELKRRLKDT